MVNQAVPEKEILSSVTSHERRVNTIRKGRDLIKWMAFGLALTDEQVFPRHRAPRKRATRKGLRGKARNQA